MATRKTASRKPVEILLVEDNPGDVRLLEEALKESAMDCHLHVVRDGEQALTFVRQQGKHAQAPRPSFILLDLHLPRINGREVLAAVKQDRRLRQIPVFVVSTSTRAEDIAQAYDLHANCYIAKPVDLEKLVEVGRQIEAFWLGTALLPG